MMYEEIETDSCTVKHVYLLQDLCVEQYNFIPWYVIFLHFNNRRQRHVVKIGLC